MHCGSLRQFLDEDSLGEGGQMLIAPGLCIRKIPARENQVTFAVEVRET
jgi:hypothetical protein